MYCTIVFFHHDQYIEFICRTEPPMHGTVVSRCLIPPKLIKSVRVKVFHQVNLFLDFESAYYTAGREHHEFSYVDFAAVTRESLSAKERAEFCGRYRYGQGLFSPSPFTSPTEY